MIEGLQIKNASVEFKVTISIGLTQMSEDQTQAEELLLKADEALYYAKENGRNQVAIR